jgi:hypothetical protein
MDAWGPHGRATRERIDRPAPLADLASRYQKFVCSQGVPKLGTYMPNMLHISPV